MLLYYEVLYQQHEFFEVFVNRQQQFLKYTLFKNLKQTISYALGQGEQRQIFLLDESRFDFVQFDCLIQTDEPLSMHTINTTVTQKIKESQLQSGGKKLFFTLDHIIINGEPSSTCVGRSGQIYFKVYVIYIKITAYNDFVGRFGLAMMKDIVILPQSFHTMMFLKHTLGKDRFHCLRITDVYTKLISFNHGFYEKCEKINIGIKMLKSIYQENNILPFFYKQNEEFEKNTYAKNLITESLHFFSKLLSDWLANCFGTGQDLVLFSQLTQNQMFIDIFTQEYQKRINGYILPFHNSKLIKTFGHERSIDDADILISVNQYMKTTNKIEDSYDLTQK